MAIFKQLVDHCWFVFKWGILALLVAGVGLALFFYSRVNNEIRQRVLAIWQSHYKNYVVTVGSAQLVDGEGIEIRGLSVLDPNAAGPRAELAYFDEVILFCQTSLPELLKGQPEITRALVRRATIHATRRPDGTWSAMPLLPIPKCSKYPLEISIENATLEIFDPLKNPPAAITLRDINLVLKPQHADSPPEEWSTEFRGYFTADRLQRVEFSGKYGPKFSGWEVHGLVAGLELAPELLDSLPGEISERVAPLAPLRGQVRVDFSAAEDLTSPSRFAFNVAGHLNNGRYEDTRLPYPLTDLKIDFRADRSGIAIDNFSARNGPGTVRLSGAMQGWQFPAPLWLKGKLEHLVLSRVWESLMPPAILAEWQKFRPSGEIDADVNVQYDGHQWLPEATIRCLNVGVTYFKFPYPLEHGAGTIVWQGHQLSADLTAAAGGQPLRFSAQIDHPGAQFTGEVNVSGENIPFDQNLLVALPEKSRAGVAALNPTGTFNMLMRVHREDPSQAPSTSLTVTPNLASVRYEKFPYPIHNIRGTVVMTDNRWTFRDMEGTNGSGRIQLRGYLNPATQGIELGLQIAASNIALQDELREALQPPAQRLWSQLRPQGAINLSTDIHYLSATHKPEIFVRAEPVGDSASLEPAQFPYRLDHLRGTVVYRDGHLDLQNIRAVHDRTPLETSGSCDFDPHGNWHLRFERVAIDRLHPDRDLVAALSGQMKRSLLQLNPSGAINVAGTVEFFGSATPETPVRVGWNLSIDVHQGAVDSGIRIENINGGARLIGEMSRGQVRCRGNLAIDSLTVRELQFTQIQGPFYFDEKQLLIGSPADPPNVGEIPHRLSARVYGGYAQADGRVLLGDDPRFSVQALLTDGDLKRFAHENLPGKQKIDGKVLASIDISGTGRGVHALLGRGQVRLTQADIYELPLMVSLLKLLSIKTPDSTAFTNSAIDYRIEGDHVYLDKITFDGDAISLEGSGEMGFDTAVKLTFHALVGRSEWQVPGLKTVLGAASRQLMQIHVTGTLADAKMTREVLPAVNQALQQVSAGVQSMERPPTFPQTSAAAPAGNPLPAR